MSCPEALRTQAYFDGELDADAAPALETHLETCAACSRLLADLRAGREAVRAHAPYHRADAALRGRIAQALAREDGEHPAVRRPRFGERRFWSGAASGAAATALAAGLALFLVLPPAPNALVGDVINAHLRSMMSDHLVDVVSSDRHTVKPWFAGHTDVSPPAVDFASQGYTLIGGRADYVDGHRTAVVVYRHGAHIINVFAWTPGDEATPGTASRNGYHMVFWTRGGLAYCAVSDTGPDELQGLERLIKDASGS